MAGGAWEGLAQATGRLPGLALNIAQLQQQGQHMRALEADSQQRLALEGRRIGMAEEAAGREKTAWEHSEKKRVEQETVENAFTPVSLVAPNLAKMPTLQKQFVEAAQSAGYKVNTTPDGEVYVQNKAIGHIKGLLQTNTDFMKMTVDNTLADLTNQSVALSQQIAQIQESGKGADEKTLGPLLEKQKAVKTQIASIIGVKEGVMAEVIKKQAEPVKPVSVAPGGTLVDPKDGTVVYTAPADTTKSQTEEQLTARALKGDTEAKSILDAMEQRKVERETRVSELVEQRMKDRTDKTQDRADRIFSTNLRKEFNNLPEVKEYNQTVPKIKSMEKAFAESKKTKNFVAVDQALITLFNKLTDPNSVVRESEYARTAENIPLLNQIKGKVEKIAKGGAGLTQDERGALMKMAQLMFRGYEEIRGRRMNEYRGYGRQGGLKEDFLSDSMSGISESGNPYGAMSNEDLLRELGK